MADLLQGEAERAGEKGMVMVGESDEDVGVTCHQAEVLPSNGPCDVIAMLRVKCGSWAAFTTGSMG